MNNDYRPPACLVSFYVTRNTFTINIGLRGTRAECDHLLVRGKRISSIAALCTDGIMAVTSTTETINADIFYDFVRGELLYLP